MTTTSGDPWLGNRLATSFLRIHPLAALLLLAAAIRLPLAFWPNVIHADEIYQSLDPAWRILGDDGIITWEWRYGIRSWFLPSLLAGPVGLGDWIAPGGTGAFIAPRLAAALASLSIVASAWVFGARISRTHAIIAAFVAAIWFEFVSFAPHTLSEPLATAIILPAAALLTRTSLAEISRHRRWPARSRFRHSLSICPGHRGACTGRLLEAVAQPGSAGRRRRDRAGIQRRRRRRARHGAFRLADCERAAKSALRSCRRTRRLARDGLSRQFLDDVVRPPWG